ncbi:MAG: septum formation initiator family protein [Patescibacteria group bacterium]
MSNNFRSIITFIFLVVGIGVIVITFVLIVKERKRARVIQDEIYALEQEKKQYEHENMELQDKVAYLQSEHSYEKEAKKLNYKKQGEHVVIVRRSPQEEDETSTEEAQEKQKEREHYQVWLDYFFK